MENFLIDTRRPWHGTWQDAKLAAQRRFRVDAIDQVLVELHQSVE